MIRHETFDDRLARSATTADQAEQCLLDFIREGIVADSTHNIHKHSQGFDLYLPWFMEVIEYRTPFEDQQALGIPELQRLYMDAAWRLVMKGKLRPGPKLVGDPVSHDAYGKAFSLIE